MKNLLYFILIDLSQKSRGVIKIKDCHVQGARVNLIAYFKKTFNANNFLCKVLVQSSSLIEFGIVLWYRGKWDKYFVLHLFIWLCAVFMNLYAL